MRRNQCVSILLVALVLIFSLTILLSSGAARQNTSITVVEHADTEVVTDLGEPGDTVGDVLTFANPVFDAGRRSDYGGRPIPGFG